jgi:hypothetical protein
MPTLDEMVDEVKSNLIGYTLRQDRLTYVTNPGGITTSSSAISIGSSDNLAKGIIEIDDELIWIDSFDKQNNQLNVAPGFGRGYMGTTPAPQCDGNAFSFVPTRQDQEGYQRHHRKPLPETMGSSLNNLYLQRISGDIRTT